MSHELIVRPEAEAELAEAFDWYEQRLTGLGSEFLFSVEVAFRSLRRNPYQYPVLYRDLHRVLLHRFPYQVLFNIEVRRIFVLAVFHAKRDPKHWRERS